MGSPQQKFHFSPMSGVNNLSMAMKHRLKHHTTGNNSTLNSPSKRSEIPFLFKTFDSIKEIWEIDEDFFELRRAEREYKRRIITFINLDEVDQDNRENLIWKIKKICDTFELSDDTFYSSVLLNDFQEMAPVSTQNSYNEK